MKLKLFLILISLLLFDFSDSHSQRTILHAGFLIDAESDDILQNMSIIIESDKILDVTEGFVNGPRIIGVGKSLATTGRRADPANGRKQDLMGDPDPAERVASGIDDARKAERFIKSENLKINLIKKAGRNILSGFFFNQSRYSYQKFRTMLNSKSVLYVLLV